MGCSFRRRGGCCGRRGCVRVVVVVLSAAAAAAAAANAAAADSAADGGVRWAVRVKRTSGTKHAPVWDHCSPAAKHTLNTRHRSEPSHRSAGVHRAAVSGDTPLVAPASATTRPPLVGNRRSPCVHRVALFVIGRGVSTASAAARHSGRSCATSTNASHPRASSKYHSALATAVSTGTPTVELSAGVLETTSTSETAW